jgi:hypothetical protein
MNYDRSTTFMTQEGYCHLLPDRIVLTKDGLHQMARYRERKLSESILEIAYIVLFTALLTYKSWELYPTDKVFSLLFAVVAVVFVFRFIWNMRYSKTSIIPRDKIRATRFVKAFPYLTRSRFIVTFEGPNGELQTRLIPLPGWLNEGDRHTDEAIALLKKEQLLPFPSVAQ